MSKFACENASLIIDFYINDYYNWFELFEINVRPCFAWNGQKLKAHPEG